MNNAAYALLAYIDDDPTKAWGLQEMTDAIKDDHLLPPESSNAGSDEASEAFDDFCSALGRAYFKKAVPLLLDALARHPEYDGAAEALAELGERPAVDPIIIAYEKNSNKGNLLLALAKLNTPQAVDFIVAHLDEFDAPEALVMTRSVKALPALEAYSAAHPDAGRAVRLAIVQLSHTKPADELLRIGENPKEHLDVRTGALLTMRQYDTAGLERRLLHLYSSDRDAKIKFQCIELLKDKKGADITAAMIQHALTLERPENLDQFGTEGALLEALNKRLGTDFDQMDDLCRYLVAQRKRQ